MCGPGFSDYEGSGVSTVTIEPVKAKVKRQVKAAVKKVIGKVKKVSRPNYSSQAPTPEQLAALRVKVSELALAGKALTEEGTGAIYALRKAEGLVEAQS